MKEFPRIQPLPKDLSDKIAAGEVVERPLSIVKELIENSIDAGSNSIVIDIKNGGKTYLRITDNGCGILRDDISLAFSRYATSKITKEEDLNAIQTLGFRGEALSSIAAVSIVDFITKAKGEPVGSKTIVESGLIQSTSDIACEEGTTIIVRDLFYNVPARKKFLKPDHVESSLIIDYISKITLAYPHIKFKLINNGTILFATQGTGDIHRNILTVYSKQTDEDLIPLSAIDENHQLSLKGFIGKPDHAKKSRRSQIFFINGRWINSKMMEAVIHDAYSDKLFAGRYPAAFLFLSIDPGQLDVNIHPNKMNVRLFNEALVRDFMYNAIRQALLQEAAVPHVREPRAFVQEDKEEGLKTQRGEQVDIKTISSTYTKDRYEQLASFYAKQDTHPEFPLKEPMTSELSQSRFVFSELNILGSLFATYILTSNDDAMYIIDQHAAHERILFEELMHIYTLEKALKQILMLPFIIEVPQYLKEGAKEKLLFLEKIGYSIEEFGPKEYIVKEIPSCMDIGQAEIFVNELLEGPTDELQALSDKNLNALIMAACKAAVKSNDPLSRQEIKELLFRLDQTENPFSCPHGRPTFVKLSNNDLERLFKRK